MANVTNEDWRRLMDTAERLDPRSHLRRPEFSDAHVVLVLLWARLHNRPMSWAALPGAWPIYRRKIGLPSVSTLSRRARSVSVQRLLTAMEAELAGTDESALVHVVDGKPLVISRHSIDAQARHGRGAGGMDKGYKIHAICGLDRTIRRWRLTPLNASEPEIARRLVRGWDSACGYLLGDTIYDWDRLHRQCADRGLRLLAPRRPSRRGRGVRERGVSEARLSCIAALEHGQRGLPASLMTQRRVIEGVFARLETRWAITAPPFFIRGLDRTRRWVQAAIILDHLLNARRTGNAA